MTQIKRFHESPNSVFEEVQKVTDGDYLLTHLYLENENYRNHFQKAAKKNREIIIDNSIFEGKGLTNQEFVNIVREIDPTWFIVPDVLEDVEATLSNYKKFTDEFPELKKGRIGVVQGKNYQEIVRCYEEIHRIGADMIAISFDYSYYEELYPSKDKLVSWCEGRKILIDRLLEDKVIDVTIPIHLLGCSLAKEFSHYTDNKYSFIYSIDTSNPVVAGIHNLRYNGVNGLDTKPSIKLCDLIDLELNKEDLQTILYNIETFKRIVSRKEGRLEDFAKKSLGDSTSYAIHTDQFDSSLLNPMPRELGRKDWGIKNGFEGIDVWHCHEASFLTNNGLPVAGTLKFSYPATSELMVESKSAKLYLNSFDMCRMGDSIKDATENYIRQIKQDLENLLKVNLEVSFHNNYSKTAIGYPENCIDLVEAIPDIENVVFDDFKAKEGHLRWVEEKGLALEITYRSNILRSRCRHTLQKDTGELFIKLYTEEGQICPKSLLRQVISLREQNEFHELLSEKLYQDLTNIEGVKDCMVLLMYNRRGSLDINPVRTTRMDWIPEGLSNVSLLTQKTQGQ